MMTPVHEVMIVEDNPLAQRLIVEAVRDAGFLPGKVCSSVERALPELQSGYSPDVMLLDVNLPGMDGISAVPAFKRCCPSVEIVIQTVFEDPDTIMRAIRAGVSGYVLKGMETEDLGHALRDVLSGGSPLSPIVARRVMRAFRDASNADGKEVSPDSERPSLGSLTCREREILEKLIQGYTYRDIGFELGISTNTVNSHLRHIYEKLQANTRAEAVAIATGRM